MSEASESTWQCSICTLINQNSLAKCAVCGQNKPSSSRRKMPTLLLQEQEAELSRIKKPVKKAASLDSKKRTKRDSEDFGPSGKSKAKAAIKAKVTCASVTVIIHATHKGNDEFATNPEFRTERKRVKR
eukprot:m.89624 g.89624  ORF g.89624 m.89624 type:complete len:129 (-) comp13232_c0_seq6:99-485(-)